MSDMNIFKRKTIVIDDDENMETDNATIANKLKENKDFNSFINKKSEENKSNLTHPKAIKSETINKEKRDLIQSINITKSNVIENISKQKSSENRDVQYKSTDKNKLNFDKQIQLDKIKKAIQTSSLPDKKKLIPLEKEVSQNP